MQCSATVSTAIALATSRLNALAGARVQIASAGSGTHTIKDGSDGRIYDCNRRLPPINMMPNAAPLYRQARAGFREEWAQFTSATIHQQFYLNETSEINPQARSVAFLVHHGEGSQAVMLE